jgi:hypothetical protein
MAEKKYEVAAYAIQSIKDAGLSNEIAPVGWSTFKKEYSKLEQHKWVQAGCARIVALYIVERDMDNYKGNEMNRLNDAIKRIQRDMDNDPQDLDGQDLTDVCNAAARLIEIESALECILTRWQHMQESNGWNTTMGESGSGGLWASQLLDKAMRTARAALKKDE